MSEVIRNDTDINKQPARPAEWRDYFNGAMRGKEFVTPSGKQKMIVIVKPGQHRLKNHIPQRIKIMSGSLKYSIFPFNIVTEVPQGESFILPRAGFVFNVEHDTWYIATPL